VFNSTNFKSLRDMERAFPNEDVCINHFRALRWPEAHKIPCPHCGVIAGHYTLANNTHKCRDCRRKFTVRAGTIFEDSKIPLRTWFIAIFLMTSHKKGISSCQLARDVGVTQKTAWFMLHRIRNAAATKAFKAPLIGNVEMDHAYVGGNPKWQHASKNKGLRAQASSNEKKAILGMLQRGGELRLHHVPDSKRDTLIPVVLANIREGTRVHTDEAVTYKWMRSQFAHQRVNHAFKEYVRGDVTTNRIEGVFSHFKRSVTGVYHQISDQHLDRYLQMFAYRWNRRDMSESDRVNDLLRATKGKRLTHKALIN
jgi:transposase-like protein